MTVKVGDWGLFDDSLVRVAQVIWTAQATGALHGDYIKLVYADDPGTAVHCLAGSRHLTMISDERAAVILAKQALGVKE